MVLLAWPVSICALNVGAGKDVRDGRRPENTNNSVGCCRLNQGSDDPYSAPSRADRVDLSPNPNAGKRSDGTRFERDKRDTTATGLGSRAEQ